MLVPSTSTRGGGDLAGQPGRAWRVGAVLRYRAKFWGITEATSGYRFDGFLSTAPCRGAFAIVARQATRRGSVGADISAP
jgi:hypothetical protein